MEKATELNVFSNNSTFVEEEENECIGSQELSCIVNVVVMSQISSFCLICNSFTLLVLHRIHDMHDVTKLLMRALTIADLGVGFFGLLTASLKLYTDIPVNVLKNVARFFQLVSLCILAMTTVVRYIAVSQPLRLETLVTTRRTYTGLTCATLVCLAFLTMWVRSDFLPEKDQALQDILDMCSIIFIAFVLVSVIILYVKLLLIARHQARRIAAAEVNAEDAQVQLHRSNIRSLKTFLIITATVCITWMPTLFSLSQTSNIYVYTLVESLRYSSSWLNTVIYSWRNETFRKVAKKLICRKGRE